MTTWPPAFTSSAVLALTVSPGLLLRASRVSESTALSIESASTTHRPNHDRLSPRIPRSATPAILRALLRSRPGLRWRGGSRYLPRARLLNGSLHRPLRLGCSKLLPRLLHRPGLRYRAWLGAEPLTGARLLNGP